MIVHRGAVISTTLVCLKSAEPFYEPSGPSPLGKTTGPVSSLRTAGAGRALRYASGSASARRPTPAAVTFLNGRKGDISKWWTHTRDFPEARYCEFWIGRGKSGRPEPRLANPPSYRLIYQALILICRAVDGALKKAPIVDRIWPQGQSLLTRPTDPKAGVLSSFLRLPFGSRLCIHPLARQKIARHRIARLGSDTVRIPYRLDLSLISHHI